MLDRKQLRTNVGKSKFVIMANKKSRTACLEDAKESRIQIVEHSLENYPSEKYLGDQIQISEKGTEYSGQYDRDNIQETTGPGK